MTDIRARLADALRQHEAYEADWGIDGCCCGDRETELHPEHVAGVLLSLPGIAIVEPASDGTVWFDHGWVRFDESEINPSDPDQLRRFAATLLAAANAAEASR